MPDDQSRIGVLVGFIQREEKRDLAASEASIATALDLSTALYDFSLTFEVAVLSTLPEYAEYDFKNFFIAGRNRPARRGHQLQVKQLSYESPFRLLGLLPKAVELPGIVERVYQSIETVYTAPVRLRVAKKRLLVEDAGLNRKLYEEQHALEQLKRRVERQPLQLKDAEILELEPGDSPLESLGPDPDPPT
jgi:hypothetical protein